MGCLTGVLRDVQLGSTDSQKEPPTNSNSTSNSDPCNLQKKKNMKTTGSQITRTLNCKGTVIAAVIIRAKPLVRPSPSKAALGFRGFRV